MLNIAMDQKDKMTPFVVLLAVLLGSGGLIFVFSDLGPGEGVLRRVVVAAAYFFFSGGVIGFFHPKGWFISTLAAWGGVLLGGFIVFMAIARYGSDALAANEPPFISSGLIMLFGSLSFALLGGVLGRSLSRVILRKDLA